MAEPQENQNDLAGYREITTKFFREHKEQYRKLKRRGLLIERNATTAEYLKNKGMRKEAAKLRQCSVRMVGNDPDSLKPEHYCQQTCWCVHCDDMLARKRSQQLIRACQTFAEKSGRGECVVYNIIVKPGTIGVFENSETDLRISLNLLLSFREQLTQHHKKLICFSGK
jgi:hypothetical protein